MRNFLSVAVRCLAIRTICQHQIKMFHFTASKFPTFPGQFLFDCVFMISLLRPIRVCNNLASRSSIILHPSSRILIVVLWRSRRLRTTIALTVSLNTRPRSTCFQFRVRILLPRSYLAATSWKSSVVSASSNGKGFISAITGGCTHLI